ncbi:UPF0481 protein At3g47200-like [Carya illinoinensis]|uniref:UPF0481 protein At3g47200-like n=1 Tax=Carya illinoinensis TaxID=32201 RepID=UPI001C718FEB|nr:UPF0481 protein At3g47200-like [Carya illinoinensis]
MEESATMKIEDALDQSRKLNFRPLVHTIYRVPYLLRKVNEEAYTPQLISIGPFHYRSPKLQSMENFKLRFLEDFMKRIDKTSKELVSIVKDLEKSVRECYEETIEIESDDFMKMILLDACFIIEYFLRDGNLIELKEWQTSRMKLDLISLENRLPLFIIKKLYELLPLKSTSIYPTSFLELTFNYYRLVNDQRKRPDYPDSEEIRHFLDLMRYFCLPNRQSLPKRCFNIVTEMYSATQLAEAGLKFKPISSGSLIDLKFNEGVLEIQNFLINTVKDVDLLVDEKIIVKGQGTNIRPTLPNNLCTGISYGDVSDDYSDICRQLVDFRKKRWYVILKSSLRKDYFRTPWMGAATIGAIILLILTLIQTVCAVISIFK